MKSKFLSIEKLCFSAILLLAFVLRFYKLGEVPLSLDWDENSNPYNAYSILKTGRDEYGNFLPLANRSFDDYKPPLYMYLNVITVAIFGLTPFAARLPSAVFGFLTIPAVYLLAKKLFETELHAGSVRLHPHPTSSLDTNLEIRNHKSSDAAGARRGPPTPATRIALIAALFLAVSPWHLQFSRVGFEATVGLFFSVAAITAFLYGLKNKKLLILSAVFLGISSYSYHTQRIFVPLLFIAAFFLWKKEIFAVSKKFLAAFCIITILVGLPLVILIPPKVILQRFETTTGRPRLEDIEKSIKFILQDRQMGFEFGRFIHNRRLIITQTLVGNYISHFDFNFLFTRGDDNLRHHIKNMGMLYLFEMPLFLVGIYLLIKKRTKESIFILLWLVFAPIPASPAVPNPHGNRALPMVVALEFISAYAMAAIFHPKNIFPFKKVIFWGYCIWIVMSFLIYLHNYWRHYPYDEASFWQYGYSEAVLESEKVKDRYQKINVSKSIEQAYVFWLFNTKYDPYQYQKGGTRYNFDKYYFDVEKPPTENNELFISDPGNFPGGFEIVKTIYYPDGGEAVKIGHPR